MNQARPRFCRYCANHGFNFPVNGHRGNCQFENCACTPCQRIRDRNRRERDRRQSHENLSSMSTTENTAVLNLENNATTAPQNQSAAAKRADNTRKRRDEERNTLLNKHLHDFFSHLNKESQAMPFMSNVGRAFRSFVPCQGVVTTNSIPAPTTPAAATGTSNSYTSLVTTQPSSLQKLCFLEEMFPEIDVATLQNALDSCNQNLNAVLNFLTYGEKDERPSTFNKDQDFLLSFAATNVPSGSKHGPVNLMSALLSSGNESGPLASPSNDETGPGRRQHRCHYCGLEWPALIDNHHCPQCNMPYNKRYRY